MVHELKPDIPKQAMYKAIAKAMPQNTVHCLTFSAVSALCLCGCCLGGAPYLPHVVTEVLMKAAIHATGHQIVMSRSSSSQIQGIPPPNKSQRFFIHFRMETKEFRGTLFMDKTKGHESLVVHTAAIESICDSTDNYFLLH